MDGKGREKWTEWEREKWEGETEGGGEAGREGGGAFGRSIGRWKGRGGDKKERLKSVAVGPPAACSNPSPLYPQSHQSTPPAFRICDQCKSVFVFLQAAA